MGSRLTVMIPRMLPNCGYTSGVEEFGGRREAGEHIMAGRIFKSYFIRKYLISRDHYIVLLNSTLKKIIILKSSIVLKVYNFLEDLPI